MIKTDKQRLILKLMVIALNEAIRQGVIDLNAVSTEEDGKHSHMTITIAGRPTVLNWFDAGYDELRITIWWDYQPEMMPTWRKEHLGQPYSITPPVNRRFFRHIMGLCGSCYLERRAGKFIIGEDGDQFFSTYVREDSAFELAQIHKEQPMGYATHGRITD